MNCSSCPQLSDAILVVRETSIEKRCNSNYNITGKSDQQHYSIDQATHLDAGNSLEINCTTLVRKLIEEPARNGVGVKIN